MGMSTGMPGGAYVYIPSDMGPGIPTTPQYLNLVSATTTRTVGKRGLRILLECFLVIHLTGLSDKQVIREKETLFTELKDSRYEVAALKEELEKERKHNEEKQMALHRDIRKLAHKLKGTKRNQRKLRF